MRLVFAVSMLAFAIFAVLCSAVSVLRAKSIVMLRLKIK